MVPQIIAETESLLKRLRSFYFPGGETAARRIRAIITTESGWFQMAPSARAIPFTAEQHTDCTSSSFVWKARLNPGKLGTATVVDSYQDGHGSIAVRALGLMPAKKFSGRDVDLGELQRYLASIALCPAALVNHSTIEFQALDSSTLRAYDTKDWLGAYIDFIISRDGMPAGCQAQRPRLVGKHSISTPWFTQGSGFRVYEGLRVPTQLEARWDLPEGPFTYYRSEVTSFRCLR